jgi:uncharacterized protein (DUF1684 family)
VRVARTAIVIALGVAAASCASDTFTEMVHVPPIEGYETRLAGFRADRDVYFATDPESPILPDERQDFAGLEYFEPDPSLYFVGDLQIYVQPETLQLVTTAGQARVAERVGFVAFRVKGQAQRLQVYRLADGTGSLFLPFQDGTTGIDTYPAGRYLNLVPSAASGPYELDFNLAYNPSCAYGGAERFACPVTPLENRLNVRIAAGERGRNHVAQQEGG